MFPGIYIYLSRLFISTYNDSSSFPLQQPTNSAYTSVIEGSFPPHPQSIAWIFDALVGNEPQCTPAPSQRLPSLKMLYLRIKHQHITHKPPFLAHPFQVWHFFIICSKNLKTYTGRVMPWFWTSDFASSNRATNGEPIRKGTLIVAPLTHQDSFLWCLRLLLRHTWHQLPAGCHHGWCQGGQGRQRRESWGCHICNRWIWWERGHQSGCCELWGRFTSSLYCNSWCDSWWGWRGWR